jgi:acetyl esterase/lipase
MLNLMACGLTLLNTVTPAGNIQTYQDLSYGSDNRQSLDIYRAKNSQKKLPVVMFIHGGYWSAGEKEQYRFVGETLAKQGYLAAVINYQLFPQVRFPVFIEDAALALAWLHEHVAEYSGDPQQLFVGGHSAGAHSAVMLTLDKHYLAAVGGDADQWIKGVFGLAGPYDFLPPKADKVAQIFGPTERYPDGNPVNFVRPHCPPMLLVHGKQDLTVGSFNSQSLADKLREAGNHVETTMVIGGHIKPLFSFSGPLREDNAILRAIDNLIHHQQDLSLTDKTIDNQALSAQTSQ